MALNCSTEEKSGFNQNHFDFIYNKVFGFRGFKSVVEATGPWKCLERNYVNSNKVVHYSDSNCIKYFETISFFLLYFLLNA